MTDALPLPSPAAGDIVAGRARGILRALRTRRAAAAGAAVLAIFIALAALAPSIAPYGTVQQLGRAFAAPSAAHWLGLDDAGADVLSLLIEGSRVSLVIGFAAMAVSVLVGASVGIVAGYFGGVVDGVLMRITDYLLAIPYLPLMIIVATVWGPSLLHVILVIGLLQWRSMARIVRAQVKSVRERTYVRRVRSLGASHSWTIVRHVVPQIGPLLAAIAVLSVADAIFAETALAFLGLSDPNGVSWGTIIHQGFEHAAISSGAWWAIVPPGLCVALILSACYLLAQAVEDALQPRLRVAHLGARRFTVRALAAEEK